MSVFFTRPFSIVASVALVVAAHAAEASDARLRAETSLDGFLKDLTQAVQGEDATAPRFLIASTPSIDAAGVWNEDGELIFPDAASIPHVSDRAILRDPERLTRLLDKAAPSLWEARNDEQLHYCRRGAPSICLVVKTAALADDVGVSRERLLEAALTEKERSAASWLWIVAALAFASGLSWLVRPSRPAQKSTAGAEASVFAFGDITIDVRKQLAIRNGQSTDLTERDVKLLKHLAAHPGDVLTKDELYDVGWGRDFQPNSRALAQHMMTLRRKLDSEKTGYSLIETVHGQGYRFQPTTP